MKRIIIPALALLLLSSLPATAGWGGVPDIPEAFWGTVTVNGEPAPVGTVVEAVGPGVRRGLEGNPVTVETPGIYAEAYFLLPHLIVQGDWEENVSLTFMVNQLPANETAVWEAGESMNLDLTVTFKAAYYWNGDYWVLVTEDNAIPEDALVRLVK